MLKVLIADDERLILNGISKVINWKSLGLELTALAQDGIEAAELIRKCKPDIVVTDVKMPGLSGLQLIKEVKEFLDPSQFIILSGFSEFEFAKEAMKYGVRYYILKPVERTRLEEALTSVKENILLRKDSEKKLGDLNWMYSKSLPFVKEQLMRESILKPLTGDELNYFKKLLNIGPHMIKVLVVSSTEQELEFKKGMKDFIDNNLTDSGLVTTTIFLKYVLALFQVDRNNDDDEALKEQVSSFEELISENCTFTFSRKGELSDIRKLYYQCLEDIFPIEHSAEDPEIQNKKMQKIIQYLDDNYNKEDLSLKWISENLVYLNTDYMGKLFKKVTGTSFNRYLMNIRIERAKDYLFRHPEVKVHDCAYLHGFGYNQQYFSRIFKNFTGLTPSEFRKLRTH